MPSIWADTLGEHRVLVRRRLLAAFAELVRERGVEATTLAAVAQRAGIARSAIYNYVGDKHDLLLAHAEDSLRTAADDLAAQLAPELPAAERLGRYVAATFRSFADEPAAGSDILALLEPAQQAQLLAHLQPVRTMLEDVIRDGLADGTFAGDLEEITRFVFSTLGGYRPALHRGEIGDPEAAARVVTDLLVDGLRGPRAAG